MGTGEEFPEPLIRFIPNIPYSVGKVDGEPGDDDYKRYKRNAQLRLNKVEKSLFNDYNI